MRYMYESDGEAASSYSPNCPARTVKEAPDSRGLAGIQGQHGLFCIIALWIYAAACSPVKHRVRMRFSGLERFFFSFLKMISRSFEWSGVPLFGTYAYTNFVQVNGSHAIVPRVAGGVTRTQ